MKPTRIVMTMLAAILLSLAAPIAAWAYTAQAVGNVNVRTGAGVQYARIGTVQRGEYVEIERFAPNGWVLLERRNGQRGWSSGNYFRRIDATPVDRDDRPDVQFNFQFGTEGFSFGFGTPGSRDRACFYDLPNYRGASFCVPAGSQNRRLGTVWNNRITSVRVYGNARVTLCRNFYLSGFCRTLTRSENRLGPRLNNQVSSYRVR